jgi:hypothetical protein
VLLKIFAPVCFAFFFASAWPECHNTVDGPISLGFVWLNEINVSMLIKAMAVVYLTPVFIFPCVIIAVVGARLGQVYMKAQIAIKREMSNAKAPVLGHFGAAVAGLSSFSFDAMFWVVDIGSDTLTLASIRAYGAQLAFREESYKRIDRYTRAGRSFYNMNRQVV